MKLFELPGLTSDESNVNQLLRNEVIQNMRLGTQLFEYAEFYKMSGSADMPPKAASAVGGGARLVNNAYVGVQTTPQTGAIALKIIGEEVKTDVAYQRRGDDIDAERLRQLRSVAKALARHFVDVFVNGDSAVDAKVFDGLAKKVSGNARIKLENQENGFQVLLGSDNAAKRSQQLFLKNLDHVIGLVNPTALLMNASAISYLEAIAREHVRVTTLDGVTSLQLRRYKEVPIVNAGFNKDNSALVIGNAETVGTSDDCTSIYAVKFGEKEDTTLATNVGIQVFDKGVVGPHLVTMVDLDTAMELLSTYASVRLEGIRLA